MKRRLFLKACNITGLSVVTGISSIHTVSGQKKKKTNIIIILADDLGYADVGYHGCQDIPTPHIDSIAANGVRFTDGYACDNVCAPSRAGFITGKYQHRFGFEDNIGPFRAHPNVIPGLPLNEKTIGDHFQEQGYTTGLIGKWHLGQSEEKLLPPHRGFDEFFGHLDGACDYFIDDNKKNLLFRGVEPVSQENEYLTDAFGREAISFIRRCKDKPFMLYIPFNAPHGPLSAPEDSLDKFKNIKDIKRRKLAAMVYIMDKNIGKILNEVKTRGMEKNTLIFFFSDNGGKPKWNSSFNHPLRGQKQEYYEGGIRIPFCIQWKGQIPAGRIYKYPVTARDILPTVLAACGVKNLDSYNFDGVNILPYIIGENKSRPHQVLFWRRYRGFAVRYLDWKLVIPYNKDMEMELYDLSKDISEKNNLISQKPELAKKLKAEFDNWGSQMKPPQFGWQTIVGPHKVKLEKWKR